MEDPQPAFKPLLITGMHRSGKSFIANGLLQTGQFNYIHEPLNPKRRLGLVGKRTPGYFYSIDAPSGLAKEIQEELRQTLQYRYRFRKALMDLSSLRDLLAMPRDLSGCLLKKIRPRRPLIDDPFALVSADWFYNVLGSDIVIVVRHPASFATSLKILGYEFSFEDLLNQEEIMETYFTRWKSEIKAYAKEKKSIVEQSALLWNVFYGLVDDFRSEYGDNWTIVRFEDFSMDPFLAFETLAEKIGVSYDDTWNRRLKSYISDGNSKSLKSEQPYFEPDTSSLPIRQQRYYFRNHLTEKEIAYIRDATLAVWPSFYSEEDWKP